MKAAVSMRVASLILSASLVGCESDSVTGGGTGGMMQGSSQVATVSVTPESPLLAFGDTVRLSAATRDAAGQLLAGRFVSWSTQSSSIATVSATGLVTAVGRGAVRIVATSEGRTGSATVTVPQ